MLALLILFVLVRTSVLIILKGPGVLWGVQDSCLLIMLLIMTVNVSQGTGVF